MPQRFLIFNFAFLIGLRMEYNEGHVEPAKNDCAGKRKHAKVSAPVEEEQATQG
ncbi:MAG: hypothetical protein ABSF91_14410 [Bacteroidota bacterium]